MLAESHRALASLETTAKFSAFAVAATYGAGFVIRSVYQAQWGISTFDLLQPRTLAAGVLFFTMLALASMAAGWIYNGSSEVVGKGLRWAAVSSCMFLLSIESVLMFTQGLFIRLDAGLPPLGLKNLANSWSLTPALLVWLLFRRRPLASASIAVTAAALAIALRFASLWWAGAKVGPSLWLFGSGMGLAFLRAHATQLLPERGTSTYVASLAIFISVTITTTFATSVYPLVRSELGGGQPIPVTLHLRDGASTLGETLIASLLHESQNGFYVTAQPNLRSAVFIPRESVTFIEFRETTSSRAAEASPSGARLQ